MSKSVSQSMLEFIDRCPSSYHVVDEVKKILADFTELKENQLWQLSPGGSYYVTRNDSSIIAFTLPKGELRAFNIAAAHSDCPSFKLKPNCEMLVEDNYLKLNTEKYGGSLLAPWFDRPLSIAGRVVVKHSESLSEKISNASSSDYGIKTVLVDLDKDVAMIPNLAIHMNREANDGYKYNPQVDLLPLVGGKDSKGKLMDMIAKKAACKKEDILGYDLFLYNHMKGMVWGLDDEYVSSRSLDDLQCVYALITAFEQTSKSRIDKNLSTAASEAADDTLRNEEKSDNILNPVNMCCIFDNEEVGSLTNKGADSTFLEDTIFRIAESLRMSKNQVSAALANSFLISADNAHALHPNHPEKADPTNRPFLNGGIVIKFNGNQRYCTDGLSEARFRILCQRAEVPVQTYTNRSDIAGGSTLGNLSNAHISLSAVDIGLPQLAMHSPFETAGALDTEYLIRVMTEYWGAS